MQTRYRNHMLYGSGELEPPVPSQDPLVRPDKQPEIAPPQPHIQPGHNPLQPDEPEVEPPQPSAPELDPPDPDTPPELEPEAEALENLGGGQDIPMEAEYGHVPEPPVTLGEDLF